VTYDGCPEGKPVVYRHGAWSHQISSTAVANVWEFFNKFK
jgi:hypothetical protein